MVMWRTMVMRFVGIGVALTLVLLLTHSLVASEEAESGLRTLYPGDNVVGWVGYPTTTQELFDQIPAAERLSSWDAHDSRYLFAVRDQENGFTAIEPGMGIVIRIAGMETVSWAQPIAANGERIPLEQGRNLVAWTGPSQTPIDLVVRSIGQSFDKAHYWIPEEKEYRVFNHGEMLTGEDMPKLRRGDGLWVFSKEGSSWLQPSGNRPLRPLGPPPDHVRWYASFDKHLDADGIAFIATENVADEALFRAAAIFDEMLVNRPDLRNTLARRRVHVVIVGQSESVFDLTPYRQYRNRIELEPFGAAGPRGLGPNNLTPTLVPEENLLCLDNDPYEGHDVAVHEFAHAIDYAISASFRSGNFRTALTSAYREAREAGFWEGTHAMRNSAEYWATGVQAWLGLVGHPLYPRITNHVDLAHYAPSLANLVVDTLGDIELHTTCQPADARSQGAVRKHLIKGSLVDANGEVPQVVRFDLSQNATRSVAASSYTKPEGTFNFFVAPGDYSLQVTIDGCTLHLSDSEPTISRTSVGTFSVVDQDRHLEIRLPEGVCQYRASGRITDASGQPAHVSYLVVDGPEGTSYQTTRLDGTFSLRLPDAGRYMLRVQYEGCHYVFDGVTLVKGPWRQNVFDAEQLAASELDLRLPAGACAGNINGTLLNHRGEPANSSFVGIYSTWYTFNPRVGSDGSFSLPVDLPGEHVLMISAPFCYVYFGENGFSTDVSHVTPFQLTDQSLNDLEIKVPEDVCES